MNVDYSAFNLQAFVNWVAEQPPEVEYDGGSINTCALAQFGYPGVALREAIEMGIYRNAIYLTVVNGGRNGSTPTFGTLSAALRKAGYEPTA